MMNMARDPDEDDLLETEITVHCPASGALTHRFIANPWDTNEILLAFGALHPDATADVASGPYGYAGSLSGGAYIAWVDSLVVALLESRVTN